jgi:hypothetical protein
MNIKDLVNFSVANKDKYQKITINELEKSEVENIKNHINIDLTGYKRVIDSHAINHVIKNHGNVKREILRGQIAVNEGDFEKISEIIAEPNTIEYAGKNDIGRDLIKFTQSKDEKLIYVEEVRSGKKEVALQTLYKQKVR